MLLPVMASPHRHVWADVAFRYGMHVYADSTEEHLKYILNPAHVNGACEDEQIAYVVKRTVSDNLLLP